MKWFDRLMGRKAAQLTYDQIASLIDGVGGGTIAGVAVNEKTALQVATVLACVRVIADGCATPRLHVFREKDDGTRERATNIPEYRLLARRPNEWQTSFEWRRLMTVHAALTGAGLSIKVRGDNRRVRELIPVMPGRWDVRKVSRYEVRYRCWDEFGLIGEFGPEDVFVLNGMQWDWIGSLNAVVLARSAVGLAMATERSQAAMHENGLRPSGVYSVNRTLTEEQHTRLTRWIKEKGGVAKAGDPLVLDNDAKWLSTALSSVDAQANETRRTQVEEMCRVYGVFPIMVGHSDKAATFASSEAFFAAHVKHTLAPWHRAWEQRFDEMLLDGSGPLFAEFDVRYLLAGSMKDRAMHARTMIEMGIYSPNEVREEEGKDPRAGGDDYLRPMNMATGPSDDGEDGDEPPPTKSAVRELRRELTELKASHEARSREPIVINNQVMPPAVDARSSITMPEVKSEHHHHHHHEIKNNVTVEPPAVGVDVHVPEQKAAAPVVVVQPAPVTVVDSHPVKSITVVERDDDKEMTRTVTTYERAPS